jgi:Rha family phage regulatory protein
VAEVFGKKHKNVLQAIEMLECSESFTRLNFQPSEYKDSTGRKLPMYRMTRDGWAFLVMGFTGAEAAHWKEKYIAAFNAMERHIDDGEKRIAEQLTTAIVLLQQGQGVLTDLMKDTRQDQLAIKHEVVEFREEVRAGFDSLGNRVSALEDASYRKINKKTRKTHQAAIDKYYNGLCPICRERKATRGDHFYNGHWNDLEHTWLICEPCHIRKHNDRQQAVFVLGATFKEYQRFVTKHLNDKPQLRLFKAEQ